MRRASTTSSWGWSWTRSARRTRWLSGTPASDSDTSRRKTRRAILSAAGRKLVKDAVGGGRHHALHTAARLIARNGEDAVLSMGPSLGQRVRQQRQSARLAVDVAQEQVDEPRFEVEPARVAGPVMAARTCVSVMGPRRYRPSWTRPANNGSPLARGHEVGAQRQDDRCPHGAAGQRVGEGRPLGLARRDGEQLFQLVDHDRCVEGDSAETGHRVGTGREHHDGLAPPADGGHEARARQRRLAAPRRPHDGQHPCAFDSRPTHAAMSSVRPKNPSASADVVREQSLVRAERRRLASHRPARTQRRVVLQRRQFDRHEGGARVDATLPRSSRRALSTARSRVRPGAAPSGSTPPRGAPSRCSRSGSLLASAAASVVASSTRPSLSSASASRSSALRLSSRSRAVSSRPGPQPSSSANGTPWNSSSASRSNGTARAAWPTSTSSAARS